MVCLAMAKYFRISAIQNVSKENVSIMPGEVYYFFHDKKTFIIYFLIFFPHRILFLHYLFTTLMVETMRERILV